MIANRVTVLANIRPIYKSMVKMSYDCLFGVWLGYSEYYLNVTLLEGHARAHSHAAGQNHTNAMFS